jgi:hypothetical protein
MIGLVMATVVAAYAQSPVGTGTGASVSGIAVNRSTLNSSVTITTGNAFQTVLASNQTNGKPRQSLTIDNNNATDTCWVTFGVLNGVVITAANAAKGSSIQLLAGQALTRYWPYVPNDEIEATCASTSDTLYVDNN